MGSGIAIGSEVGVAISVRLTVRDMVTVRLVFGVRARYVHALYPPSLSLSHAFGVRARPLPATDTKSSSAISVGHALYPPPHYPYPMPLPATDTKSSSAISDMLSDYEWGQDQGHDWGRVQTPHGMFVVWRRAQTWLR